MGSYVFEIGGKKVASVAELEAMLPTLKNVVVDKISDENGNIVLAVYDCTAERAEAEAKWIKEYTEQNGQTPSFM